MLGFGLSFMDWRVGDYKDKTWVFGVFGCDGISRREAATLDLGMKLQKTDLGN